MNGPLTARRFSVPPVIWFLAVLASCGPQPVATPTPPADTPTSAPSPSLSLTLTSTFTPTLTPDYSPTPESPNPYLGPVPTGALARLGKGHAIAVAYSPDGQDLAVASDLGVFVYRADTLTSVWSASLEAGADYLAYSPDGARLAVAVGESMLHILDARTGAELVSWEIPPLEEEIWPLCAIAFSPDGALLAGLTMDKLFLWNPADGKRQATLTPGSGSDPCGLDFSPDGKTLASATGAHLTLWNMADSRKIREMQTPESLFAGGDSRGKFSGVEFLPDGKTLVTNEGSVWDSGSGKIIRTLEDFGGMLVKLSPDGGLAANEAGVWRVDTGSALWSYPAEYLDGADSLGFSPDGRRLAAASDNGVILLSADSGEYQAALESHFKAESVAFSKDGKSLISWDGENSYRRWDAASLWLGDSFSAGFCEAGCTKIESAEVDIPLSAPVNEEAVSSPDGKLHVLFGGYYTPIQIRDDAEDGAVIASLPAGPAAAFSPDGRLLATADASGSVLLWDVAALESGAMPEHLEPTRAGPRLSTPTPFATATPLPGQSMDLQAGAVLALAYSSDGADLTVVTADGVFLHRNGEIIEKWQWPGYLNPDSVAVSPDGATVAAGPEMSLWNVATAQQVRTLMLSGEAVFGMMPAFSADGKLLAAVTAQGIGVWKTATGSLVRTLGDASLSDLVFDDLAFSPDGKTLAAAAGTRLYLWDLETGRLPEPVSFNCRGEVTYDQVFSSDGKTLVIACGPSDYPLGFLSFWDMPGQELHDYLDETTAVHRLAYPPGGNLLAMGLYDGRISLWGPGINVDLAGHGQPREGIPFGPSGEVLGIEHEVTALVYSPDGKTLASGSLDGTLILTRVSSLTSAGGPEYASTAAPSGCALAPGIVVHARENARLWSVPDLSQAEIVGQPVEKDALLVLSGPQQGWIKKDQSDSGWFWEVSMYSGGENPGWIWQSRIQECP